MSIVRRAIVLVAAFAILAAHAQTTKSLKPEGDRRWYKGNTHTHTLWSDGDAAPELAVDWYKERDYDFLSITDHNVMLRGEKLFIAGEKTRLTAERLAQLKEKFGDDWVETSEAGGETVMRLKTYEELRKRFEEPGKFILIEGEEITAKAHVNGLNIRDKIPQSKADTTEGVVREHVHAVDEQSRQHNAPMLAHVNHPNWGDYGVPPEDLIAVDTSRFFEVYNGHGGVKNWGDEKLHRVNTDRYWDIVLAVRLAENPENILYGVATDDAHDYFVRGAGHSIPGRGWCMVLAENLEADSIMEAFNRGDFYASSGVLLNAIEWDEKEYRVTIDAEHDVPYKTIFYGTRKGADLSSKPTLDENGVEIPSTPRQYSADIGVVLAESHTNPAVYAFKGDEMYVRAKVVSSKLKADPFKEGDFEMAWTQPAVRR
ncbi:MAG: hypothetical protein HUU46_18370 [Candidatus Hydrogenedentes bacterium]|nr:hypothetical protein [Candidatus Hydrogenedentota bacterium]